ncbi:hypothetical protein FOA52_011813 [Chlamydomonas sp. UWO 241]|nr:hypothetical protein FOA52_011813 [Chlamydomonas sp. UWO 241]
MARSTLCLAATVLLLAFGQCYAAVEGVQTDEATGKRFIMHGDAKWMVVNKEGIEQTMFLNEAKGEISYEDPRTRQAIPDMPVSENPAADVIGAKLDAEGNYVIETSAGPVIVFYDAKQKRVYFHNPETGDTQWEDPRMEARSGSEKQSKPKRERAKTPAGKPNNSMWDSLSVGVVAMFPVLAFIGAIGARIFYLHVHHPELLFPTKERKDRRKKTAGLKTRKGSGKMSQDGKGGRSANS